MRRLLLPILLLLAVAGLRASEVDSVRIDVRLDREGAAHVTERWAIDVQGDITEWYLVLQNLGDIGLRDFAVSEDGRPFVREEPWDIHRSRAAKAARCGTVSTDQGYELCWGIGSNGRHLFQVSYTLTGLVKVYDDGAGFNHMFVARGLSDAPQRIRLTITAPDSLERDSTGVWAFGFKGDVHVEDGSVVATTSEPFSRQSGLIVMVQMDKGLFPQAPAGQGSFEAVKQRAMEGSDYVDDEPSVWQMMAVVLGIMGGLVCLPFFIKYVGFYIVLMPLWRYLKRRRLGVTSGMDYCRDIPRMRSLRKAHKVMDRLRYTPGDEALSDVIGAYLLRLINQRKLSVTQYETKDGFAQALQVKQGVEPEEHPVAPTDVYFENELLRIVKEAAGDDRILQPKELKQWAKANTNELYDFYRTLSQYRVKTEDMQYARQLFGLKKYLKDFSLIDERHVVEVRLWDEYMVYAQLFGMAKQVRKDLREICPEYFELSETAQMMEEATADDAFISVWGAALNNHSMAAYTRRQAEIATAQAKAERARGGGGSSSWGGGGGFSGGGFGGGGR